MTPAIHLKNIGKRYGNLWVLRHADFRVDPGTAHALLGENGAGKSTLIKIIAGVHAPSEGTIQIGGADNVSLSGAGDAMARGIAVVHQELDLFDNLTVAENIALDSHRKGFFKPSRAQMTAEAERVLALLGETSLTPDTSLGQLTTSDKQKVAIAKALGRDAKLIVFDEPTSSLNGHDADQLMELILEIKARGIAIVYVSHKMTEILRIADQVTVLRDGAVALCAPVSAIDHEQISTAMLGRPAGEIFPERPAATESSDTLLAVKALAGRNVNAVSFEARRGEVLALAGRPDSGASETLRLLFGLNHRTGGEIRLGGTPYNARNSRDAVTAGVGYISADRLREGIMPLQDVMTNVGSVIHLHFGEGGESLRTKSLKAIADLNVKARSPELPITALSGGNQQKALLARWIAAKPKLLLLDDPTRGVDVGAKQEIYRLIRRLAAGGTTIVYTSSETHELTELADRILLFRDGSIAESFSTVDAETLDHRIAS
ncbi:sugar ABC transporter ATP-binding protein [Kaistia algarum]|uniref:sugar ABC transporter ATP-binding protein n=1 Tax=Kaistia algarum TaxID=2083279 RepID=UPI001402827F|nr:sugar ABC transporter ATP-binding protein [Kaistia algarum]MCX5515409.1 sugar ABC transporter ATP-binding protein [Kaistia algarum]